MNTRICTFIILLYSINLQAQGPISGYMPQDGQWDFVTTYSSENYTDFYKENGDKERRLVDQKSYNLFIEHGMTAHSSLVITLPYIHHNQDNKGLQDASVWTKFRNAHVQKDKGAHNLITALGLSVPLSNYANDNPQAIGNRAAKLQGRFAWQYTATFGWFTHIQTGLDFQFAPDAVVAIPILLRTGIGTHWFYADAWFEHFQSINSAAEQNNINIAGVRSSWSKIGATFYVPIQPWIGIFTGGSLVLSGKNIGDGKRFNLGMVFRIRS